MNKIRKVNFKKGVWWIIIRSNKNNKIVKKLQMMKLQRKLNNQLKYYKMHLMEIIIKIWKIIMLFWKLSTKLINKNNKIIYSIK